MSESDSIVAETAARIFADLADPQTINAAKDEAWKAPLWKALEENGLTLAWVPEDLGGAGAGLADGFEVVLVAGRYAAPVPITETLIAGWLLAQGGIASPAGMMTVAPMRTKERIALNPNGMLSGRAHGIPFVADAAHIAVLAHGVDGPAIALVATSAVRAREMRGIAGNTLHELIFEDVKPLRVAKAPAGFDQGTLMLMGAAVRSLSTAGALSMALDISVRYAGERVAFERTISKFQAVQHNLARLAGEVAASNAAATSAADAIANASSLESPEIGRAHV